MDSCPIILANIQENYLYGYFKEHTSTLVELMSLIRLVRKILRKSIPPPCSLRNSSSSAFLNIRVGSRSLSILLNTKGAREIMVFLVSG
jgi:hypothetical protein